MEGFEAHHRLSDFLDEPIILFNQVVEAFDLADFNEAD